jgi:hypothetical protein
MHGVTKATHRNTFTKKKGERQLFRIILEIFSINGEPRRSFSLEEFRSEFQGDVNETDEDRNLDEGPNHGGKSLIGADAKDSHRNSNGQLKIIARRCKRNGCSLSIVSTHFSNEKESHEPHQEKINDQRDGNPDDIQRKLNDIFSLEGEHDDNRK